jgi:hypothetical protein
MLVYVVGFQPLDGIDKQSGFEWFPGSERDQAVEKMLELVRFGDTHSVSFVPVTVPKVTDEDIQEWLLSHHQLFEVQGRNA